MKKIFWVSRHDMSPAQLSAVRALHGDDVEIVKDPVVFADPEGLAKYIREHRDGFVYAVAGAPHYLTAAQLGESFGIFENHPEKRAGGSFGLATVYHLRSEWVREEQGGSAVAMWLQKVWTNPDPMSDTGEVLVPVAR